jgi:hypothetical protein
MESFNLIDMINQLSKLKWVYIRVLNKL